jgi:geranylgeranyl diphosphate synthase, type II
VSIRKKNSNATMPNPIKEQEILHHLTPLPDRIEASLKSATLHALNTEGSFSRANADKLGSSAELFHLASLLLDDLPCMDNAELRRSKPCTHVLYGENTTILSALGLINQAYFHLWSLFAESGQSIQEEAARVTRDCLGFDGILDGQSKDMNYFFSYNDRGLVTEIAEKKTGSLLRLCLLLPAVLTETSRYEKHHLSKLASDWGLAYQIADDLKDLFYSENASGKSSHRDAQLGRPNMALAIGETATVNLLSSLIDQSNSRIETLKHSNRGSYHTLQSFQMQFSEKVAPLLKAFAAA